MQSIPNVDEVEGDGWVGLVRVWPTTSKTTLRHCSRQLTEKNLKSEMGTGFRKNRTNLLWGRVRTIFVLPKTFGFGRSL